MSEIEEKIHKMLVEDGFSPKKTAEIFADAIDIDEEKVLNYIKNEYPLTDQPGRRGLQYCLRCNPHLNGTLGKEGTEAVVRHRIPDRKDIEQVLIGTEPLCEECTKKLQGNPHVDLEPITDRGKELLEDDEEVVHECENPTWTKTSLVTENEGFDYVKCDKCGIKAKRYGMGNRFEIIGFDVK
jgi:hypothetical protein